MKTALEYFIEQLDCLNIERKKNLIDAETFFKHKKILTQQAKAMEKEQSECICVNVIEMILDESEQGKEINSKEIFEKCYKETFK